MQVEHGLLARKAFIGANKMKSEETLKEHELDEDIQLVGISSLS